MIRDAARGQYNPVVESQPVARRIYSLTEACRMLPEVKELTAAAARRVEALTSEAQIEAVIREWSEAIEAMGLEAKGLWLVDFDNGQGYYCWRYPEETVSHFHDYDGGFQGRMKIV